VIAVSLRYEQSDHMTRVFQLTNWRRFDEAISEAEQWLREEPENANAYGMLAQIYMKSGKYDKALHWSAESLKYDPENKIGWFVRVIVLYSQGKEKEYLQAVKEAQRIDPYESHYLFLSFNLYHKKGKLQQAREELDPTTPCTWLVTAICMPMPAIFRLRWHLSKPPCSRTRITIKPFSIWPGPLKKEATTIKNRSI
jgi:predicted Zn-dependent protease